KKHASSHLGNHPRSDPERVVQDSPGREPWRHGRPGCQPGKAEAACTALSGRASGPDTIPRAQSLGKGIHLRTWGITHAPTLKGSCRIAQGASPGKKRASSHLGNHPGSDPERVVQQRPGREPWAVLPEPLRDPFQFPDLVRCLTARKTVCPQCPLCPAASALRGRPRPSFSCVVDSSASCRKEADCSVGCLRVGAAPIVYAVCHPALGIDVDGVAVPLPSLQPDVVPH
ncbi:MAG: hypothetical protein H6Q05_2798, partial [Acidobacteria bacterium]|nr:hypothetical protein [Acidobacteriota bacterium]